MKFKLVLGLCICCTMAQATNTIKGKINQNEGQIQLLVRTSPFDDNVELLAETQIQKGEFEFKFDLPHDTKIRFSVNGLSISKQVFRGSNWSVKLRIEELEEPDVYGNLEALKIDNITSDLDLESRLFLIEQDIESLREIHQKRNGKIGKGFEVALNDYLLKTVQEAPLEFQPVLANSMVFAFALSRLKKDDQDRPVLEKFLADQFKATFSGLEAVKYVYYHSIYLHYILKKIGKVNYFEYADASVAKLSHPVIRQAVLSHLVTNLVGRKGADQEQVKAKLTEILEQAESPELASELLQFYDYHFENDLIGQKLQDIPINDLTGASLLFSEFRGQYLLLDFWATWCGPCIKNMKKLPDVKQEYENLTILCVTNEQDVIKVGKFISKNGYAADLNFGIASDPRMMDSYFNKIKGPFHCIFSLTRKA